MTGSSSQQVEKSVSFSENLENVQEVESVKNNQIDASEVKIEDVSQEEYENEVVEIEDDRDKKLKADADKIREDMKKERNPHVVYDSFLKPGVAQKDNSKKSNMSKEEMEKEVERMQKEASAARAAERKSEEEKSKQERQLLQKIIAVFSQDKDEARFLGCALVLQHGVAFRRHDDYYALLLKAFPEKFLGRLLRSNHVGLVIALVSFFVQAHKEGGLQLPTFVKDLSKDLLSTFKEEVDAYLSSKADSDRLPAYLRLLAELDSTKNVLSANKMRSYLSLVLRLVEKPNVEQDDGDDKMDFSFSPPVDLLQSISALTFHWRESWESDDAVKTQLIAVLLNAFIADDDSEQTKSEQSTPDKDDQNKSESQSSNQVQKSTHVEILPFLAEMLDGTDCYICAPEQVQVVTDRCLQRVHTILRTKGLSSDLRVACIRLAGCLEDHFGGQIWWRGENLEAVKVLMQIVAIEVHVNLWTCLHEDEKEEGDLPCREEHLTVALSFCERMCATLMEQEANLPLDLLPQMFNALHKSLKSCFEFLGAKPDGTRGRVVPAVARLVCFWTASEPRHFASEFLNVVEFLNSELSRTGDLPMLIPALFAYEPIEWVPFASNLVDNLLELCMSDIPAETRFAASSTIAEAFLDYRLDMKEYLTKEPPMLEQDYRSPSISPGNTVTPSSNLGIDRPQLAVDADDKVRKLCLWAANIDADCVILRLALVCTVPNHIAKVFIPQSSIDEIISNALAHWEMLTLERLHDSDREGQWFQLARALAYSLDLYPSLLRGYGKLSNDFCAKRDLEKQGGLEYTENSENNEEALTFDGEEQREAVLEYLLSQRNFSDDMGDDESDGEQEVVEEVVHVEKKDIQDRIVEVAKETSGQNDGASDDEFLSDGDEPLPAGFC